MGELGHWFVATLEARRRLPGDHHGGLAARRRARLRLAAGRKTRSWINPSPNAANLSMARAYAGTVMLEGTTLSEGRGTTRPLELFGAPDIDAGRLLADMRRSRRSGSQGCVLRDCWFEPTFHKHAGQLCAGVQIHVEDPTHYDHAAFRPWRLQALAFKALRTAGARLPAVARLPLRVRARPPRDRPHQRRAAAARVGGRPGFNTRRPGDDHPARRGCLGSGAQAAPALLSNGDGDARMRWNRLRRSARIAAFEGVGPQGS